MYIKYLKKNKNITIQPFKNSFSTNIFWVFGILINNKNTDNDNLLINDKDTDNKNLLINDNNDNENIMLNEEEKTITDPNLLTCPAKKKYRIKYIHDQNKLKRLALIKN